MIITDGLDEYRVDLSEVTMKTMLVSAFIALFAFPAVAGEVPKVTLAPAGSSIGATTSAEAAATVATGQTGSMSEKSPQQSIPSFSAYGGGCDRGHASTEAMLIN
jgi:hypothetical protein